MEICYLTPNSRGPHSPKRTGHPSFYNVLLASLSVSHSVTPPTPTYYVNPTSPAEQVLVASKAATPESARARAHAKTAGQVEAGVRPPRHGQRSRGETARGQGDDGGRRHVPVQDPRLGGRGAARPPAGPPAPGVGGGAPARRARAPAGPRRAAQAREALLPGADPPRRRRSRRRRRRGWRPARAAQDVVVGRAAARGGRPGAAGEPDAVPAHRVGRVVVHRAVLGRAPRRLRRVGVVAEALRQAVVRGGGRGRRGAAAHAPAQGRGGAADEGEQGPRRGRRADHAALRRQGPGRRHGHAASATAAGLRAVVRRQEQPDAAAGLPEEREADEVHGGSRRDHRMTTMRKPRDRSSTLVLPFSSPASSLLHQQDDGLLGSFGT